MRVSDFRLFAGAALGLCAFTGLAFAGPIIFDFPVDTSSLAGTNGSLDFNFNPGPLITQAASLQLLSFSSNGSLSGSPSVIGDVTGALPSTVAFDNGTAFNDYFQTFTFGSMLAFQVNLFGPALSAPDGMSTSGSTFAFTMFSDAAGTKPVLTTDTVNGFAFTVNVNLDGTTTSTSFLLTNNVPEPNTETMVLVVLIGLAAISTRRISATE